MQERFPDLLFLDIRLSGMDGRTIPFNLALLTLE
jgi:CheY-like chemotaxis protein